MMNWLLAKYKKVLGYDGFSNVAEQGYAFNYPNFDAMYFNEALERGGRVAGTDEFLSVQIDRDEYAPGVWAGSEGMNVLVHSHRYVVSSIDYQNGIVNLRASTNN